MTIEKRGPRKQPRYEIKAKLDANVCAAVTVKVFLCGRRDFVALCLPFVKQAVRYGEAPKWPDGDQVEQASLFEFFFFFFIIWLKLFLLHVSKLVVFSGRAAPCTFSVCCSWEGAARDMAPLGPAQAREWEAQPSGGV